MFGKMKDIKVRISVVGINRGWAEAVAYKDLFAKKGNWKNRNGSRG